MATAEFSTVELCGSQCQSFEDHNQRCRIVIIGPSRNLPGIITLGHLTRVQEGVQPPSRPLPPPHRSQHLLKL